MQGSWAKGFTKIIFKRDSKQVHGLVMGIKQSFRKCNSIREILAWRDRFEVCVFTWVSRNNNKVADHLSKTVLLVDDGYMFHYYVPISIINLLHEDNISSSI